MSSEKLQHLIDIESLSTDTIRQILQTAQSISENRNSIIKSSKPIDLCMAFFEPSTRTRCSFEIAAKHLGLNLIHFDANTSSAKKGESLLDTFQALCAMGVDAFVVRHSESGVPQFLADRLLPRSAIINQSSVKSSLSGISNISVSSENPHFSKVSIINAGDGQHAHPTQALLDLFTIQQYKAKISDLSIAIVGDISHSRVARSQIALFRKLGVSDIRLIAPNGMIPTDLRDASIKHYQNLNEGIKEADVVIALRIQQERMQNAEIPNFEEYFQLYGIKPENLRLAKKDAIVLHPGPINREIDIASAVADGPQSVILQQIANGVLVRMAILQLIFQL